MNPQEDDKLRQFWLNSQKEAPAGFSDFIMQNLPAQTPLPAALKKPLLSPWIIGLVLGFLLLAGLLISRTTGSSSQPAPEWQQSLQAWFNNSLGLLDASSGMLTSLALLSVAVMLLIGLDRLLKQKLARQS